MNRLIAGIFGLLLAVPVLQAGGAEVSGITDYVFDAAPQTVARKMFNWEVTLSAADSKKWGYEVVQVNHFLSAEAKIRDTTNVLVDSKMLAPNPTGIVHFALCVGSKEPRPNVGGPDQIGEPIVYAGLGTTKVQSDWITLPGTQINRAAPSGKGTELVNGQLKMMEYEVTNKDGQKVQTAVIFRRAPNSK
jgi:hypothetical protein